LTQKLNTLTKKKKTRNAILTLDVQSVFFTHAYVDAHQPLRLTAACGLTTLFSMAVLTRYVEIMF